MKKNLVILIMFQSFTCLGQTDMDGLMMNKNFFCAGVTYSSSVWKNYWEGTLKRDNPNLGKVTTNNVMLMGNYGISKRLNLILSLPYINTNASAGVLKGQQGIQDLSLFAKWVAYQKHTRKGTFNTILISGVAAPVTNYTPDLLPLSIGLYSKTASLRGMIDYQKKNWFGTLSGTFVYRNNVKLDRNTYYTTQMHYTNEVKMPNASNFNIRAGYRSEIWIIEAFANQWNTLGGFDIGRNNMPFVSNEMNATSLGIHVKYDTEFLNGLSFVLDGITTVAGRNSGQSSGYQIGIFYIMDFSKKKNKKE